MRRLKINPWVVTSLFLAGALAFSALGGFSKINLPGLGGTVKGQVADEALAEEIYPLFACPCCGQPLDKKNICCEQAQERINYIDSLAASKTPREKIILAYVKKYGLASFVDKGKANELKEELAKVAPSDRPIITLAPQTYDFGDVSLKKGKISALFDLKNEGKSGLVISKLDTSCGCTSASIIYQGKEGPLFAMAGHGTQNPTDWSLTVPAGGEAQLKVYYDPDVHKDFRGPATREISVFSNDPIDFEKKVLIELNQVD